MNKIYIVILEYAFDSSTASTANIVEMLNSIGHTLQLSEHSFIMASPDEVKVIRDAIKNSPYDIDRIFVSEVSSPSAWSNLVPDNSEIKKYLRNEL